MSSLTVAREEQIDAIYAESHAVWGSDLDPGDYRALWTDLARTPWGREFATFCVWSYDRGRVLSSAKVYRPRLRICGRTGRTSVSGAVFTPAARRNRGHAGEIVREMIAQAAERGDQAAMLFSDIGVEYYASFGFRPLPAGEEWGSLPAPARDLAGLTLRPLVEADLPSVHRAHAEFCETRPIAVLRDDAHWHFIHERSVRFFERLNNPDLRMRRQVAERDGRFAGYLFTIEGRGSSTGSQKGTISDVAGISTEGVGASLFISAAERLPP